MAIVPAHIRIVVVVVEGITVDGQARGIVIGRGKGARGRHQWLEIVAHHGIRGLQERRLLERSPLLDVVGELHGGHS